MNDSMMPVEGKADLAPRLRAYAKDQGGWHNIDDTCEEAADRIEALEAALIDFRAIAAKAKPNCGPELRAMIQAAQEKHQ